MKKWSPGSNLHTADAKIYSLGYSRRLSNQASCFIDKIQVKRMFGGSTGMVAPVDGYSFRLHLQREQLFLILATIPVVFRCTIV